MSIVVAGKSLKQNYTPISNSLIRNKGIDDSTFRLICWMTSHDEGFEVSFSSIQSALDYGRDKLRKILKNAEIHNFLVRRKIRTKAGLFDFEYHIFKDTNDARAFRESLSPTELTSDNRRKRHIYMDSKLDDLPLTIEKLKTIAYSSSEKTIYLHCNCLVIAINIPYIYSTIVL